MSLQQPMLQKVPVATPFTATLMRGWRLAQVWIQWFQNVKNGLNAAALVMLTLSGVGTGSIGPIILSLPVLTTGLYRFSIYLQVTTAASVSSSLTPSVTSTSNGVSTTQTAPAAGVMASNDAMVPANWSALLWIDSSSVISYALAYASVGVQTMVYRYNLVIEQLPTSPT